MSDYTRTELNEKIRLKYKSNLRGGLRSHPPPLQEPLDPTGHKERRFKDGQVYFLERKWMVFHPGNFSEAGPLADIKPVSTKPQKTFVHPSSKVTEVETTFEDNPIVPDLSPNANLTTVQDAHVAQTLTPESSETPWDADDPEDMVRYIREVLKLEFNWGTNRTQRKEAKPLLPLVCADGYTEETRDYAYRSYTINEMKEIVNALGLSDDGKKADIFRRIWDTNVPQGAIKQPELFTKLELAGYTGPKS